MILALEPLSEERLGGGDVPLGAKQEIDGVSLFVDSAVKIRPTASDFDVVLIDAPGPPSWASEAVPALLELWHIALDPAHDRRMRQGEPAFGHHRDRMTFVDSGVEFLPLHPVISFAFAKVESVFDHDRAMGVRTRVSFLEKLVASRLRILGYHLPWPGVGFAARSSGAYRFLPEPQSPFA
jgi:hypothetical protein